MAVVAALSTAVFTWFLLGQPSIPARIYAISVGAGVIALMVVRALWPIERPYLIDRVLFWVAALSAANLLSRPIVILSVSGGGAHYGIGRASERERGCQYGLIQVGAGY